MSRILLPTLAAAAALVASLLPAQARAEVPSHAENLAVATGEVFLKGSIDGKRLFLVLGAQQAAKATKKIARWAVDARDLRELGRDVYNRDHDDDFVDAAKEGAEFSADVSHEILKAPWRSLQKIPRAYRVNFDRAQDSLHGAKHPTTGALKYAGWAVWANIQGAYYLVIEAPAEFIGTTLGTALGVPGALAFQGIEVAWDLFKISFKYVAGAVAIAAVETYSFLSAGTATVLTLIAAGAVATYQGGKWLVYDLPRHIRFPVQVERATQIAYGRAEEAARRVQEYLKSSGPELGAFSLISKVGKYESVFDLVVRTPDGEDLRAVRVTVGTKKGVVTLKAEGRRKYLKLRRKSEDKSRREMRAEVGGELARLVDSLDGMLKTELTRR